MMRGVVASMLCCGAAAQMVSLNGDPLANVSADNALGEPYGADGTLVMVAEWLAQPQAEYFRVPAFGASDRIVLTPDMGAQNTTGGTGAPVCGQGWAKVETGESECFDGPTLGLDQWGWTNKIKKGDNLQNIPVYIDASECAGGMTFFNIDVKFDGTTITVDLSNGGVNQLKDARVYVGEDLLPKRNGEYAPGHLPVRVNGKKHHPVLDFEDMDGEEYWFAVHINACVEENDPPACSSTFYATQYFCQYGPCTDGVNGNLAAQMLADGWESVRAFSVCFTTEATGDFPHETRVLRKEISEAEELPTAEGDVKYLGLWATGCGESVTPPPPAMKPGPGLGQCFFLTVKNLSAMGSLVRANPRDAAGQAAAQRPRRSRYT